MKALVTGATGFVGAAVTRALLGAGWSVRALVRARSNPRNLRGLPVDCVSGDLADSGSLARALQGCGALFHVAAAYQLWTPQPQSLYDTNVEGTRNLLQAARRAGIERIVYTSSVATIGRRPDDSPADETDRATLQDMIGHYKRSKYLAEQCVLQAARSGLPVILVNPSTPVGPGDWRPTPTGRLVLDAALGRTPAYVDTGLNIVHVDDVARGHLLAFEQGRIGERYILGGTDLSLRTILTIITASAGRAPPRLRLPHAILPPIACVAEAIARLRGCETRITLDSVRMARHPMYFSSAKAVRELGYRWRPADEALADAVRWCLGEARPAMQALAAR